jgi:hypothetical protein
MMAFKASKDLDAWFMNGLCQTGSQKQSLGNVVVAYLQIHVVLYSRIDTWNPCHFVFARS